LLAAWLRAETRLVGSIPPSTIPSTLSLTACKIAELWPLRVPCPSSVIADHPMALAPAATPWHQSSSAALSAWPLMQATFLPLTGVGALVGPVHDWEVLSACATAALACATTAELAPDDDADADADPALDADPELTEPPLLLHAARVTKTTPDARQADVLRYLRAALASATSPQPCPPRSVNVSLPRSTNTCDGVSPAPR